MRPHHTWLALAGIFNNNNSASFTAYLYATPFLYPKSLHTTPLFPVADDLHMGGICCDKDRRTAEFPPVACVHHVRGAGSSRLGVTQTASVFLNSGFPLRQTGRTGAANRKPPSCGGQAGIRPSLCSACGFLCPGDLGCIFKISVVSLLCYYAPLGVGRGKSR